MKKTAFLSVILAVLTLTSSFICLPIAAAETTAKAEVTEKTSDNGVILETVNLVYVNKNKRGAGYVWDNINDTLTLTNATIDTTDGYGLRLPEDCTLVLEGKNTIRASKCALSLEGNLTVKGSGSLALFSDGYGINASSTDMNKKLTFREGTVTVNSASDGIYSEYAVVTQNGKAKLEINAGEGAYAVNARQVKLLGGSFAASSSIFSKDIKVSNVKLSISSSAPAFIIDGAKADAPYEKVKLTNVKLTAGDAEGSAQSAEEYSGQCYVATSPYKKYTKASLALEWITGEEISGTGYIDFVLIGVGILILAAFIATPYIRNKKEKQKIEAVKAAAREEEKRNMKEANARNHADK